MNTLKGLNSRWTPICWQEFPELFWRKSHAETAQLDRRAEEADSAVWVKKPQYFLVKLVNLETGTQAEPSGTRILWTPGLVLSRLLRLVEPVGAVAQRKEF